jgi:protocatechuate 3,4-dioxygenase beta subunit
MSPQRRRLVAAAGAAGAAWVAVPAWARTVLPRMTDGPFYPSPAYRARALDWDADLTTVAGALPDGQPRPRASGQLLDLFGKVVDPDGKALDRAEVEIWQCDAFGSYRHPRGAGARVDEGFQGFGSSVSDGQGVYRFRTIRPVPYPGRTPHIHVKVRHAAVGEVSSQLFVAGDPGNERDFLFNSLSAEQRASVELRLQRAPAGSAVMWLAESALVVGR